MTALVACSREPVPPTPADNAELAYRRGALSLTELIDARRTLRITVLDAVAARSAHAQALGAWQLRTGQPVAAARP